MFNSKLPWKMANGSYADEIEYMIDLKKNNKLTIISSPVGYLRSIHNAIPLNWKEDALKKKQKTEKKQLEKTRSLREEEKQRQRETRKTELYQLASNDWNSMAQEEKQPWFDMAKQQQDDRAQKGFPVFRRNNPKHLWATAKILFLENIY